MTTTMGRKIEGTEAHSAEPRVNNKAVKQRDQRDRARSSESREIQASGIASRVISRVQDRKRRRVTPQLLIVPLEKKKHGPAPVEVF